MKVAELLCRIHFYDDFWKIVWATTGGTTSKSFWCLWHLHVFGYNVSCLISFISAYFESVLCSFIEVSVSLFETSRCAVNPAMTESLGPTARLPVLNERPEPPKAKVGQGFLRPSNSFTARIIHPSLTCPTKSNLRVDWVLRMYPTGGPALADHEIDVSVEDLTKHRSESLSP